MMDERSTGRDAPEASTAFGVGLRTGERSHGVASSRSPTGTRFAGSELGAWYVSSSIKTSVLEVANGIRREIVHSALQQKTEELRE